MPRMRRIHYVHEDAKTVPAHSFNTRHTELHQQIWERLQSIPRPTLQHVQDLIDLLPPEGAKRLVHAAIDVLSDDPATRNPTLRKWFRGRLRLSYPMSDRIARALAECIETQVPGVTSREQQRAPLFPSQKGLALDFLTLVALRLVREKPVDTSAMFTRGVGRVRTFNRCH